MPISTYLVDQIAVGAFVDDSNLHGLPSYAAPVVVAARIEDRARTVRKQDGTTVTVTAWVVTNAMDLGPRDRIWLAPSAGHNAPRTFPPGYVFLDSDARTPVEWKRARRRGGTDGHVDLSL